MEQLLEDPNSRNFRNNEAKRLIYQASYAVEDVLNDIQRRAISLLRNHRAPDNSEELDLGYDDVRFNEEEMVMLLSDLDFQSGFPDSVDTTSVLISVYLIQESDLDISLQDVPHPRLVEKVLESGYQINPLKRVDSLVVDSLERKRGFYFDQYQTFWMCFIPVDKISVIKQRIDLRITDMRDFSDSKGDYTKLISALKSFPEEFNDLWFRKTQSSGIAEGGDSTYSYFGTLCHEYLHYHYYKFAQEGSSTVTEGFSWFGTYEVFEKESYREELKPERLSNYDEPEAIYWIVTILREKYELDDVEESTISWVIDLQRKVASSEMPELKALIYYILPDELKKEIDFLESIFSERFQERYRGMIESIEELEYYRRRKKTSLESKKSAFEDIPENYEGYFQDWEEIVEHLEDYAEVLEEYEEDLKRANPKGFLRSLTGKLLDEAVEERMDLNQLERRFRELVEEELRQMIEIYRDIDQLERDLVEMEQLDPQDIDSILKEDVLKEDLEDDGLKVVVDVIRDLDQASSLIEDAVRRLEEEGYGK